MFKKDYAGELDGEEANEWVLKEAGIRNKDRLLAKSDQAKLRYFGHVVRGNGFEKEMLQGMVFGKRSHGRQKTRWIDGIASVTK